MVTAVDLVAAGVVLVVAVGVGTLVHELSHALALRALGVPCQIQLFPGRREAGPLGGTFGRWATVRPTGGVGALSPWRLRVAAVTPLVLLVPFALVPLGVAPDPFAVGDPVLAAAAVGWAGCALPSPQDFALVWYPERALATHRGGERAVAEP